jgi:3-deoxy-D-arabino-heptulosonate 7-phosphate (DAHP) synthase class II
MSPNAQPKLGNEAERSQTLQDWSPASWMKKAIKHDVTYPNPNDLQRALDQLHHLPPLVTPYEVRSISFIHQNYVSNTLGFQLFKI